MSLPSRIRSVPRIVRYVIVIIALAAMTRCASAATRYVAPCGNDAWLGLNANCAAPFGPKRTIQAAINASVNGDQVSVLPGTYVGGIDTDGKAIRILGLAGAATTILDGNGTQRVLTINSLEGAGTILEGLTIANGDTASGGGGALISLASPSFIDCVFSFNHADGDGGAVWCSLASPTFTGCTFHDNSAGAFGGGIHAINGGVSLIECLIDDNVATHGGGICFNGGNHDLADCDISNNTATFGGGMNVRGNANVEIIDSDLSTNNAGHLGGGLLAHEGADIDLSGGSVAGNVATNIGGGLATLSGSSIDADNVMIAANSASLRGGGANVLSSVMNFNACTFWANESTGGDGGAVSQESGSTAVFDGCFLFQNTADGNGGAVHAFAASTTIVDSPVESNSCDGSGGAVWADSGTLDISNSTFETNHAGDDGGAIALDAMQAGDATFEQCLFQGNDAFGNGGAIVGIGSFALVADCTFQQNDAGLTGGAIAGNTTASSNRIDVRDGTFTANTAGSGAAVGGLDGAAMDLVRCTIEGNSASGAGGGVYFFGDELRVASTRLIDNAAPQGAGAAIGLNATASIVNSVFAQNTALNFGGGLSVSGSAAADVINCTFSSNTSSFNGGAIYSSGAALRLRNSIVWNNGGSFQMGGGTPIDRRDCLLPAGVAGPNCFSADPMFLNAAVTDYSLAAGSPGIDAGLNWHLPRDVSDVDDDGNVLERVSVDAAGNPRVTNGAPGGCGPAAIVDLGAFETAGPVGVVKDGDVNGDGVVNVTDLLAIISGWGNAFNCPHTDLNGDGTVNVTDLLIVIANWG